MGFLSRLLGLAAQAPRLRRPYPLTGGGFAPIVGESYRQQALARTARSARRERDEEGEYRLCFSATLVRERDNRHDPKAVAVYSPHGLIGYAPRGSAWAELLDLLADRGYDGACCQASLTGGTKGKSWGAVLHARPEIEIRELRRRGGRR
jgi:hypothetical protein